MIAQPPERIPLVQQSESANCNQWSGFAQGAFIACKHPASFSPTQRWLLVLFFSARIDAKVTEHTI